jgi:hypothetical protein
MFRSMKDVYLISKLAGLCIPQIARLEILGVLARTVGQEHLAKVCASLHGSTWQCILTSIEYVLLTHLVRKRLLKHVQRHRMHGFARITFVPSKVSEGRSLVSSSSSDTVVTTITKEVIQFDADCDKTKRQCIVGSTINFL